MPRIVPSDVTDAIKRAYPQVGQPDWSPGLDGTHAPTLASILRLIDEIPSEFTALLSPPDYRDYLFAIEAVRYQVAYWAGGDPDSWRSFLVRLEPFGLPHPVDILYSTFAKLPDEAPALVTAGLTFIKEEDFRVALRQDISTAYTTLSNNEFKAAAVIAGSVVEALLLWALKTLPESDIKSAKNRLKTAQPGLTIPGDMLHWHLPHFAGVACHADVIDARTYESLQLLQHFRNLIHPGRQERLQEAPSQANALLALGAMQRTIDDITAWAS